MIEVADVFRCFAADYLSAHGVSMLPSHRRAIEDILNCPTAALGGQVWRCEACDTEMFAWHSCGNRSCPKCHTAQTQEWLEHRQRDPPRYRQAGPPLADPRRGPPLSHLERRGSSERCHPIAVARRQPAAPIGDGDHLSIRCRTLGGVQRNVA
jgi:hypothetical protein